MCLYGRNILGEFNRDAPLNRELIVCVVAVGGGVMEGDSRGGLLWEGNPSSSLNYIQKNEVRASSPFPEKSQHCWGYSVFM